jgi:hypothetical protein
MLHLHTVFILVGFLALSTLPVMAPVLLLRKGSEARTWGVTIGLALTVLLIPLMLFAGGLWIAVQMTSSV